AGVGAELAVDGVVVGRLGDRTLAADIPAADLQAGPLVGEVGQRGELPQRRAIGQPQRRAAAAAARLDVQRARLDPHLGTGSAGTLAKERQIALVHLRDHFVARTGYVDVGLQSVIAGDAANDVGVAAVDEGASPARHAQILKTVLEQHRDLWT